MHFLYSGKGYTDFLLAPLIKIGTPFLITWVRSNIEKNLLILHPFNYGEDTFLSLVMDSRTHLMYPRPHNPILPQNKFIWIELSGPPSAHAINPLHLGLHTLFILLFWKLQATCDNKIGTVEESKFIIRGLNNKVVLDLGTRSTLWLYFLKGWQLPPIYLLVEGRSNFLNTSDWHLRLK